MLKNREIYAKVEAEVRRCIDVANKHYGRAFSMPKIEYNVRGTTAGRAHYRAWKIDLNHTLLIENVDDFIARTVIHEVAHLVDFDVHQPDGDTNNFRWGRRRIKRSIHGPSWQSVMRVLGAKDITRCHQYDVTNVARRKVRYEYKCACPTPVSAGPKVHSKLQKGAIYTCKKCGTRLTKDLYVSKLLPRPRATLAVAAQSQQLPPPPTRPGTKMDQAVTIVATHGGYSRDVLINILCRDLGMTKAGATTYYYAAKKRLAS